MTEGPVRGDPMLPHQDSEPQFRFSLTRNIADRFKKLGFSPDKYALFTRFLDQRLELAANTEKLVAFALIAVPGTEGLAGYAVNYDGYIINAATLWKVPKANCNTYTETVDPKVGNFANSWESPEVENNIIRSGFATGAVSQEEYPTIESFQTALEDDKERIKRFTETLDERDHCEFWGMVTTEQLREELKIS